VGTARDVRVRAQAGSGTGRSGQGRREQPRSGFIGPWKRSWIVHGEFLRRLLSGSVREAGLGTGRNPDRARDRTKAGKILLRKVLPFDGLVDESDQVAYGERLVDDAARIGPLDALGLDETLFVKRGRWRKKQWSTSIVDVRAGQLLDVVEGRDSHPARRWLAARDPAWRSGIRYGTLDMSGPYRKVFDTELPDVVQVADPFHVCKLAGQKLDEVRRRVNQELLGHRGHKHDPLYRARRLLVMAHERLDDRSQDKLTGLLKAGDPTGEVTTAWHAKEAVRELYAHTDATLALAWVDQLSADMRDRDCPPEIRQLGRTLRRWRTQIAAWHQAQVTNGPTETMNGLAKRSSGSRSG
jgi:transposase